MLTNKRPRANLLTSLALAFALLALPGCTGKPWERDFWHPPAATGTAAINSGPTYPIQRASGKNLPAEWPNLADVPPKTDNPLPAATATGQLVTLASDRDAATARATGAPAAAGAATSSHDLTVPAQAPTPPPEL